MEARETVFSLKEIQKLSPKIKFLQYHIRDSKHVKTYLSYQSKKEAATPIAPLY